ncbi:hypothetical protein CWI43_00005, partial [Neisseria meningitidis]
MRDKVLCSFFFFFKRKRRKTKPASFWGARRCEKEPAPSPLSPPPPLFKAKPKGVRATNLVKTKKLYPRDVAARHKQAGIK